MSAFYINFNPKSHIICLHEPSNKLISFTGKEYEFIKSFGWSLDFNTIEDPEYLEGIFLTYNTKTRNYEISESELSKVKIKDLRTIVIQTVID